MSVEQTIQEGLGAERLLTDPIFVKALEQTDAEFVREWRQADTPEARESAHAKQAALDEVRNQLQIIADRGTHARASVQQQQQ